MSDTNSERTLLALLATETNTSSEPDREAMHDGGQLGGLPSLDERVEMFLAAVYGSNAAVTSKMRSAARDRLLATMAADLAEEMESWSQEQPQSEQAEAGNVGAEFRMPISESLSRLSGTLVSGFRQLLISATESLSIRSLRMAAVPLVALLVVGAIWTGTWRNYNDPSEELDSAGSNRNGHNEAVAEAPRTRSLAPAANPKATEFASEESLQREIAATESKFGSTSLAVAPKLVDLASLYRFQGRYREAEELCKRALAIQQQKRDPKNPDLIRTLRELAMVYRAEGRSKEAEDVFTRADQP
jgi:tetratricopeptide (TPR) repeat protein